MRRTILDFTGIYRNQETLRAEAQEYLDLSRMQGTATAIRKRKRN